MQLEIARRLVGDFSIPLVFVAVADTAIAVTPSGRFDLKDCPEHVFGKHKFLSDIADDVIRLCHHADAGDIVVSGWRRDGKSISFAVQNGAHAGPGNEGDACICAYPQRC